MEALIKTCPKCHSDQYTKDGIVINRQRYKCKNCHYRYTVSHRGLGSDMKRQALILYLQGLDFRSIGRILQCSHVTVYNWIKTYNKGIDEIRSKSEVKWINVQQLKQHIDNKNNNIRSPLLLIDTANHDAVNVCISDQDIEAIKNNKTTE